MTENQENARGNKSPEDIIQLTDIQSLRALRNQWNVPTGDQRLQTRNDYVRLLLEFYDRMGPKVTSSKPMCGMLQPLLK